MKHIFIATSTLLLGASAWCALNAENVKISRFKISKPAHIVMPAIGDSTLKKNFSPAKFLDYPWNGDFTTVAEGTTAANKDGWLHLAKPNDNADISGLKTSIRANRFAKGKLAVTSPLPFEVFANGKSIGKKDSSQDSISDTSTLKSPITLQAQYDNEIIIKVVSSADSKADPIISVEFIPDEKYNDVEISSDIDSPRRFSIETTAEGPRATKSSLSADGKYLITNYQQTFSSSNIRRWSVLSETASGKILNADLNSSVQWMPSGHNFWSVAKNGDKFDIYLTELPSMKTSIMAKEIPTDNFIISPDGAYLVYADEQKGKNDDGPMKRITSPDDRIPGNRNRNYLMKYSIANGITQPLTIGGNSSNFLGISPDSQKVLYLSSRETPSQFPFYANSIIQIDVNTLATDTIVKDDSTIAGAVYSPDGKKIFAWGGPSAFNGIGANAGQHPIANDFDIQGYIVDITSKNVDPVTKNFNPSLLGKPQWNKADGKIYFQAYEGFNQPLYSFNPNDGSFRKLSTLVDRVDSFSIGNDESNWISYTGQSYDNIGGLYLLDIKRNKSSIINQPMAETLNGINWGKMENWKFEASDGTIIDGNIILPPDFDATKKYPMIVYYYGGTLPSNSSMNSPYSAQLFASRDYVVYVVNPSGAIGYGQEFSARHVNAWGKRTAEDIIEGIKKLCDSHPFVDKNKIGCIGASYGGFMTQYLLTRTDLFAAAISHAGISNVASYWGEGFWGYSYNSVAAAKSYPWTNPELFTKQGSLFNADKIHTPLLLLHGTVDTNVPIGESVQLFNALKILGRDVEFITVEDQNHIIMDYDKRVLWHATIMAWFAKWLQDDPRWWDSLYGK